MKKRTSPSTDRNEAFLDIDRDQLVNRPPTLRI